MRFITKLLPASKQKLVISIAGIMAIGLFTGLVLVEAAKIEVTFTKNGDIQTLKTSASTVEELLDQEEITVGDHDTLSHPPETSLESGMEINYKQAKQIALTIDGEEMTYYTTVDTVGAFLEEESIRLTAHDDVSHRNGDPIETGIHIKIDKGYQVVIDDGGEKKKVWTTGSTVGDLLKANDIQVRKKDKVKPAKKKQVKKDTAITIVRVEKKRETSEEKIDFKTEERHDDTLAKGEEKVISEGQQGTLVKTYEVDFENGEEVSRKLISEDIREREQNRVIAIGTKQENKEATDSTPVQTATVKSEPQKKKVDKPKQQSAVNTQNMKTEPAPADQEMMMTATAYSANCDGCSGVTATGINLNSNPGMKVVAVDPGVIPLGSRVWVEGYGEAIAGDTGGAINGNRIDLHVSSKGEASAYGYRQVKVKVID